MPTISKSFMIGVEYVRSNLPFYPPCCNARPCTGMRGTRGFLFRVFSHTSELTMYLVTVTVGEKVHTFKTDDKESAYWLVNQWALSVGITARVWKFEGADHA